MDAEGRTLVDAVEILDGNKYSNCKFQKCQIVYRGGEIPHLQGCTFEDCAWRFEEAAERTLQFMNLLYYGTGENGRDMIESTITLIRRPPGQVPT